MGSGSTGENRMLTEREIQNSNSATAFGTVFRISECFYRSDPSEQHYCVFFSKRQHNKKIKKQHQRICRT
jgi:hypothetical protein